MNAVIACGGTGGHLFPGIAVAEVLRERGHEVLLFVSEKEIDSLALSTRSQFRFEKLPTVGLPSIYSPAIFGFLRRFAESLARCRSIYQKFKPQIVLGMGGFTSTAPILAGRIRHRHAYSRIECGSGKSEPTRRQNGARSFARLQRGGAVFSKSTDRNHRDTDSHRTQALGSTIGAAKARLAARSSNNAGHGRKSGRERNQ